MVQGYQACWEMPSLRSITLVRHAWEEIKKNKCRSGSQKLNSIQFDKPSPSTCFVLGSAGGSSGEETGAHILMSKKKCSLLFRKEQIRASGGRGDSVMLTGTNPRKAGI